MFSVSIFNEANSRNIGDVAINAGLTCCLEKLSDGNNLEINNYGLQSALPIKNNSSEHEHKEKKYNINPYIYHFLWSIRYLCRISKSINKIKKSNLIIIGGGGIFMDNKMQFSTAIFFIACLSKFFGIKVYCVGVSANKQHSFLSDFLFKKSAGMMDGIFVRDAGSGIIIKNNFFADCDVSGDFAFCVDFYGGDKKNNKVLINVNGAVNVNKVKYFEKIKEIIEFYGQERCEFVTTGEKEDFVLADSFLRQTGLAIKINHIKNYIDYMELVSGAHLVVASRLHAAILSIIAKTKVAIINVGEKQKNFFVAAGLENNVIEMDEKFSEPRNFDFGEVVEKQKRLCNNAISKILK